MALEQKSDGLFRYRSHQRLIQQVLEMLLKGPQSRSELFYTVRITYKQIDRIETTLKHHELATIRDNKFTITEKGRNYVKALQKADTLLGVI